MQTDTHSCPLFFMPLRGRTEDGWVETTENFPAEPSRFRMDCLVKQGFAAPRINQTDWPTQGAEETSISES